MMKINQILCLYWSDFLSEHFCNMQDIEETHSIPKRSSFTLLWHIWMAPTQRLMWHTFGLKHLLDWKSVSDPPSVSSPSHQIDSSVSSDVNHPAFQPVFSTFTLLLVDTKLPLNLKVKLQRVHLQGPHLEDSISNGAFLWNSVRVRPCWCCPSSRPSPRSRWASCNEPWTPWSSLTSPCSRTSSPRARCTATTTWTASARFASVCCPSISLSRHALLTKSWR